ATGKPARLRSPQPRAPPSGAGRVWSRHRRSLAGQKGVLAVILPKDRDPRFVTIRRGGTLTDADHHLLALWAAACAEHVLDDFELIRPDDPRPRKAIEQARAWAGGEITMSQARAAGG